MLHILDKTNQDQQKVSHPSIHYSKQTIAMAKL